MTDDGEPGCVSARLVQSHHLKYQSFANIQPRASKPQTVSLAIDLHSPNRPAAHDRIEHPVPMTKNTGGTKTLQMVRSCPSPPKNQALSAKALRKNETMTATLLF